MKYIYAVFTIIVLLIIDQWIKYHIKTHFTLGETYHVAGEWAKLHFVENEGMAFGISFGGIYGKYALSIFRLIACIWGFFFINNLCKKNSHWGLILCASLILAGALGNLVDSLFYGLIYTDSYHGLAKLVPFGKGYGKFLQGRVVDMFYFPIVQSVYPKWLPFLGGEPMVFFNAIFNFADFVISTGVISLLVFQRTLLKSFYPEENKVIEANTATAIENVAAYNVTTTEDNNIQDDKEINIESNIPNDKENKIK